MLSRPDPKPELNPNGGSLAFWGPALACYAWGAWAVGLGALASGVEGMGFMEFGVSTSSAN